MKLIKKRLNPRKEPNQERAKETVENIYQATAHILEKAGFEKASTNKIAEKAGISIGSLYQYFPSKDAILGKMIDNYISTQINLIESEIEKRKSASLIEVIEAIVDAVVESRKRETRFTKIFAQKLFGLSKNDNLTQMDERLLKTFKKNIESFENEVRMENIDLSLFIIYQSVRIIPVAIIFDRNFNLHDESLKKEMVHLCYQYLKK